jgi:hypothetical protein
MFLAFVAPVTAVWAPGSNAFVPQSWGAWVFSSFFFYLHSTSLCDSLLRVVFPCSRSFFILDTTMGLCIE